MQIIELRIVELIQNESKMEATRLIWFIKWWNVSVNQEELSTMWDKQ